MYPGLHQVSMQPMIFTHPAVTLDQMEQFAEELMPAFALAGVQSASYADPPARALRDSTGAEYIMAQPSQRR